MNYVLIISTITARICIENLLPTALNGSSPQAEKANHKIQNKYNGEAY